MKLSVSWSSSLLLALRLALFFLLDSRLILWVIQVWLRQEDDILEGTLESMASLQKVLNRLQGLFMSDSGALLSVNLSEKLYTSDFRFSVFDCFQMYFPLWLLISRC